MYVCHVYVKKNKEHLRKKKIKKKRSCNTQMRSCNTERYAFGGEERSSRFVSGKREWGRGEVRLGGDSVPSLCVPEGAKIGT